MTVLLTGVAGFIGNHLALRLLQDGETVIGIDNMSPYYDPELKRARLKRLDGFEGFTPLLFDLCDAEALQAAFADHAPDVVIHLAAQPGVRYSLEAPQVYVQSNLVGFANILEACRVRAPSHLLYASSSSVYGANRALPSSEHQAVDHPLTLYAATKKANETDGAQLQPSVWHSGDRIAVLYGLRGMGASRHGVLQIHRRHSQRPADTMFTITGRCRATSPMWQTWSRPSSA